MRYLSQILIRMEVPPISLKLESHQVIPCETNKKIFRTNFGALNSSGTGTGKTYLTMAVALVFKFSLLVICPAQAVPMWESDTAKHGIKAVVMSYSILAGKLETINHPYLIKKDGNYYPTPILTDLIKSKILVVFDESQDVKNPKAYQTMACHTITKEIIRVNNGSRIVLLSATPVDKEDLVESILKLTGIITSDELFHFGRRENQTSGYGYSQLYSYCYKKNPELAKQFYPAVMKAANIRKSMYNLYTHIVKPQIVFSMPKPIINFAFKAKSTFYSLDQPNYQKLIKGLSELKDAVNYNPDGTINYKRDGITKITSSMMLIENAKVDLFCRLIETALMIPHVKVIMYVWYNQTVDILMSRLEKYNPLRCDGVVPGKTRQVYRERFQEPNDNYRLIIAKPTSFGRAIGLHDTHGGFPRFTFINPNFKFNPIVQAAGRTYRVGTKSDVNVTLTYITDTDESNVITALSKKSEITRNCIAAAGTNINELPDTDTGADTGTDEEDDIIPDEIPFVDKWELVYDR